MGESGEQESCCIKANRIAEQNKGGRESEYFLNGKKFSELLLLPAAGSVGVGVEKNSCDVEGRGWSSRAAQRGRVN
jgi:hypothetical protein